jgi:two-component system response regulator MtrA
MQPLLLIDDEPNVRDLATQVLDEAGFDVQALGDAPDPATVAWDRYRVVVLDVGLPSIDGVELCRQVRSRSPVPIVMLTARDGSEDVVRGLEAGADDYVTKPFVPEVLVARVRAAARRQVGGADQGTLSVRDLVVDESSFRAYRDGAELNLTSTEMRLLAVLARNAGDVLSRQRLLEEVWGYDYLGDSRLVDMAVLRLRGKLRQGDDDAEYVSTVRGEGYRLDP